MSIFTVDGSDEIQRIDEEDFSDLGIQEREDLEEWAIQEPCLLGEELLIVSAEYANWEETRHRLDILALDREGKLVVVELKRDRADENTDLQAIKYASFCSTLTAEDIQKDYRKFSNDRRGQDVSPEDVGATFADFLEEFAEEPVSVDEEEGWAQFELDDQPRILLLAGEFGKEVTSPVTWLIEEYGMDITCIELDAYRKDGEVFLNAEQVIPQREAEEFLAQRREKQRKQSGSRRRAAYPVLLDRGVLRPGDLLIFDLDRIPDEAERDWDPDDPFWQARVMGDTGRREAVEWSHDGETYSFTGLTKELLNQLIDRNKEVALNGYKFWTHPEFENRRLRDLRNSQVTAHERKASAQERTG
jgi:hypothetical protein